MKKLNLGCGDKYKDKWVNVDVNKNFKADKYFDINKFPYPFSKNTFEVVLIENVLEHTDNPLEVLKEVIRICKNDAKVIIEVPHAFSYTNVSDIQHKRNFTENSFNEGRLREYDISNLILLKQIFIFDSLWKKFIPFKGFLKIFFNGIYENIRFEFEVRK